MVPSILTAALVLAAPQLKDRPQPNSLLGRWAATSLTIDGTASPQWAGLEYEFLPGGRWVIYREGTELGGGPRSHVADGRPRPATIELTEGAAGKPYPGIYQVEANRLSLSFRTGGGVRPADFNPGPGLMTFVMERVKEKR